LIETVHAIANTSDRRFLNFQALEEILDLEAHWPLSSTITSDHSVLYRQIMSSLRLVQEVALKL